MPEFGMNSNVSATDIPLARIQEMKAQGLTNNQIILTLQRQGFSSTQVFDALSQSAVQPSSAAQNAPLNMSTGLPGMSSGAPSASPTMNLNSPMMMNRRMEPPSFNPPSMRSGGFDAGSDTEEMIEAIIDEKWNDMVADINKVVAWKESTEARITKLEQQMTDLKDQFDKLHQAVVGKVGEYDQHILDVGAEVKAMEKVFSKVLPVFTDNVAELSRITDAMKRGTASQSSSPSTITRR